MKRLCVMAMIMLAVSAWCEAGAQTNDNSSDSLTIRASLALQQKDWKTVKTCTQTCIRLYDSEALKMQKKLKDFPPMETAMNFWALNDVAYAYFLQGEMYRLTGKLDLAKQRYETVIKKFGYAQKYDPGKGGDWKVAKACEEKLKEIEPLLQKGLNPVQQKLKPLK